MTVQALAAVLGGTQSLHTNGYDEALALPTERVGHAGAPDPADHRVRERRGPGGRSARRAATTSRRLTDAIEAGARALIAEVDALGGAARGDRARLLPGGHRPERLRDPEGAGVGRDRSSSGVNRFTDGSPPPAIETPDFSALEARQRARLAEVRGAAATARRSPPALAALRAAAGRHAPPHAADPRRRPRPRDARRDQRHAARGVGDISPAPMSGSPPAVAAARVRRW